MIINDDSSGRPARGERLEKIIICSEIALASKFHCRQFLFMSENSSHRVPARTGLNSIKKSSLRQTGFALVACYLATYQSTGHPNRILIGFPYSNLRVFCSTHE